MTNKVAKTKNEIILYQPDNAISLEVLIENESVWLSLNQMTTLFQRDKSVISRHIRNIFEEEELFANSVVANFATTATDGKTYLVTYYNLDVIISVGYRVKSKQGTKFRQWATPVLRDYALKGYVINQRLNTSCKKKSKCNCGHLHESNHARHTNRFGKAQRPISRNLHRSQT